MWLGATPLNNTQACSADEDGDPSLQPYPVTLVNAGSYAINWTFSATQPVSTTDSAVWATANPSSGSVPAGATAQFTVTPSADICAVAGNPGYSATLTQSGNGQQGPSQALTDSIGVPDFASFTLTPNPKSQTCKEGSVSSYTLTIDNTKSNIPITWSLSNVSTTSSGVPWVKLQGGSTQTIGAGAKQQITIAPDPSVCLVSGAMTYTADISATSPNGKTSYGTQQLKDAITVPITMGLVASPSELVDNTQMCFGSNGSYPLVGPYSVTLTNDSNVPVTWSFTSVDQITVKDADGHSVQVPWASFAGPDGKSTGILAARGQARDSTIITVTPFQDDNGPEGSRRGVCCQRNDEAIYSATITAVDTGDSSQSATVALSDRILIPE